MREPLIFPANLDVNLRWLSAANPSNLDLGDDLGSSAMAYKRFWENI
jgi:hypothetical protein